MTEVLTRWLAALRDPALLPAAVTDDIRVERFAPAPRGTPAVAPVQVMDGIPAVAKWLALTPKAIAFELAGEPVADGELVTVEYRYRVEDWSNGGTWILRLAGDKLAWLAHRPFALDA